MEFKLKFFGMPLVGMGWALLVALIIGGKWSNNFGLGMAVGVGWAMSCFMLEYLTEKYLVKK